MRWGRNMENERVQISGKCVKSTEEDICAHVELAVKRVIFHERGDYVHVELVECTFVPARLLKAWTHLDIWHKGQNYRFDTLFIGTAPIEFHPSGINLVHEPTLALRFIPHSKLN